MGSPATTLIPTLSMVLTLAAVSCDRQTDPSVSERSAPSDTVLQRVQYAELASLIADPLRMSPGTNELVEEPAQLVAAAQIKLIKLRALRSNNPTIAAIASESAAGGEEVLQHQQQLASLAREDPSESLSLGVLGLCFGLPSGSLVVEGAKDLTAHAQTIALEKSSWLSAFERCRAAQLMLPTAAAECCFTQTSAPSLLSVDIDEAWAGSADYDSVCLTNDTGKTLHNCTVVVELRSRDESRRNVHFVPEWNPSTARYARYGSGVQFGQDVIGRQTVVGIDEARVSFWADEMHAENIVYPYADRDEDRQKILDAMKVEWRYLPVTFLGGRSLDLTLDGLSSLPAHRITLIYHRSGAPASQQKLNWDLGGWKRGEQVRLDAGANLAWDPELIDVRVTFADSKCAWSRTLDLRSPRR